MSRAVQILVVPRPGEPFPKMLARFTNAVKSSGLLTEHRRGLHFVSPSEVRRRAAHRGLMRARKQQAARQP